MKYNFTDLNDVSEFVRYVIMKLGNCEIQTKHNGDICVKVSIISNIVSPVALNKYALKCNGEKQQIEQ